MHHGSIIEYTEQIAGEIATRFAGTPLDEARLWVRLAHQREAMVTRLYDLAGWTQRLPDGGVTSPSGVVRSAVLSIWAHEESHTRFLFAVRSATEALPRLTEWQGMLEGILTRKVTEGGALARALVALGASLGRAPEFAKELRAMNLRELLGFHAELETTARMGYERMLQVTAGLADDADARAELGVAFCFDVAKILCEEGFHEAAFHEMATWVAADGNAFLDLPGKDCARSLYELCQRHLSRKSLIEAGSCRGARLESFFPSDAGQGATTNEIGAALVVPVFSDGGLGALFAAHGLPLRWLES